MHFANLQFSIEGSPARLTMHSFLISVCLQCCSQLRIHFMHHMWAEVHKSKHYNNIFSTFKVPPGCLVTAGFLSCPLFWKVNTLLCHIINIVYTTILLWTMLHKVQEGRFLHLQPNMLRCEGSKGEDKDGSRGIHLFPL